MSCRPVADPRIAVAYLRASTDDQRLGPAAQRAAIEAWASREGVSITAWHVDQGVSGGSDLSDRPALLAALTELRAVRAGVLIVAKRDRLARDVYIAATIERAVDGCGARVACADGVGNGATPADAFMRTMLDGAAEYERALIRARTTAALAAKRAKGERTGECPYGFTVADDDRTLVPDPPERAVLREVRGFRAAGLSMRAIVTKLAERGIVSRNGRSFAVASVHAMLQGDARNVSAVAVPGTRAIACAARGN